MKRFTIHFLALALISGIYGFGGWNLYGTEAARVLFLIGADLFVVSVFARFLFNDKQPIAQQVEA